MNATDNHTFRSMNINVNHILTFLFIVLEIIGILGNILVTISVEFDARMRRSLTNQLIVRVASCDLIILLFNIPDIIQFFSSSNGNWTLSQSSCKLIRTILVLAQYASVLTMVALTIERFIGIVYPLRSKFLREKRHVFMITTIVWLFSLLCASPNLIYLRVMINPEESRRSCLLQYSKEDFLKNRRAYIIHKSFESIIFYFLPLILQIYCYTRIAQQLFNVDATLYMSYYTSGKCQANRKNFVDDEEDVFMDHEENPSTKCTIVDSLYRSPLRRPQSSSTSDNMYLSKIRFQNKFPSVDQSTTNAYNKRRATVNYNALKSRRSVIKMLFTVVLIYFISFSPQVLVFILFDTSIIKYVPHFVQTPYFIAFTMLLVTISSASNPIVYAIFCSKFRESFAKILRKLFCCCQVSSFYHTAQRTVSLQQIPASHSLLNGTASNNEKRSAALNVHFPR